MPRRTVAYWAKTGRIASQKVGDRHRSPVIIPRGEVEKIQGAKK